ncbi:UNVERIFIED_CONTAM: hypothetical protein BEN50_21160 [Euhalothece sp. KZN 001]
MLPKNPLFQKCLAYLETLPNLQATITDEFYVSPDVLADGKLIIKTPHQTVNYICEIKLNITNEVVEQITQYFTHLSQRLNTEERPLLITRHLSHLVVDELLEKNIEFMDVDGNIYLNSTAIYVIVRNRIKKESAYQSLAITSSALQVIYALLSQPKLITRASSLNRKKIANLAGVTPTTVNNTLKKLQDLDYLKQKGDRYEIIDYVKLLERWELGYAEELRPKLERGTFSPINKQNFSDIENDLKEYAAQYGYLIGGELASSIMTNYLRPISATLHVNRNTNERQIAVKLKLKPDSDGNITLLKTFGCNQGQGFQQNLVNPLLVHAELVRTGNSRLKETARLIYEKYIQELAENNDY